MARLTSNDLSKPANTSLDSILINIEAIIVTDFDKAYKQKTKGGCWDPLEIFTYSAFIAKDNKIEDIIYVLQRTNYKWKPIGGINDDRPEKNESIYLLKVYQDNKLSQQFENKKIIEKKYWEIKKKKDTYEMELAKLFL